MIPVVPDLFFEIHGLPPDVALVRAERRPEEQGNEYFI